MNVSEVEPSLGGAEMSNVIPANYKFSGGEQDHLGCVRFFPAQRGRCVETKLLKGWKLRFEIFDEVDAISNPPLAFAELDSEELARRTSWQLLLQHPETSEAIYCTPSQGSQNQRLRRPAFLCLHTLLEDSAVRPCSNPSSSSSPSAPQSNSHREDAKLTASNRTCNSISQETENYREPDPRRPGRPKIMMITRGTRGDVQPFLALASGLVKHKDCDVVLVTELAWKSDVKRVAASLQRPDALRFRPSGGDTRRKVSTRISRLAMNQGQKSDALQTLMLSRSEVEFFSSEGCFFHWAVEEKPQFVVFAFVLTHVAMIISEALELPIVGFSLQPFRQIEPRANPETVLDQVFEPIRHVVNGPNFNAALQQIMELLPDRFLLNDLRTTRGLAPCPNNLTDTNRQAKELESQKVPIVVPISRLVLGAHAKLLEDAGHTLTDFIYLRMGEQGKQGKKDPEVDEFIQHARRQHRRVIAMTFSSMPVGGAKMLRIAAQICQDCIPPVGPGHESLRHHPAVIVFLSGQPDCDEQIPGVETLQADKRLLVLHRPVDFGWLFPELDAIVLHGGLGVTSEALRAGIPVITSGILLLDQRYWAARVHDLQCGSAGVPIDKLPSHIIDLACKALDMRDGQAGGSLNGPTWRETVKKVSEDLLQECQGDEDGQRRNAEAVFEAGMNFERRAVVQDAYRTRCGSRRIGILCCIGKQCICCVRCLRRTVAWLLCNQAVQCLKLWIKCLYWCVCCRWCRICCFRCFPREVVAQSLLPEDSFCSFCENA